MKTIAFLVLLLAAGCSRGAEREIKSISIDGATQAEWYATFDGDSLKKIHEKATVGLHRSDKNVYWFTNGNLRLYDSQRELSAPKHSVTLHILFDATGQVTKFAKRVDGRAVALEPIEALEAQARASLLARRARELARPPAS